MLDDDGTKAIRRQAPGKHDSSVTVTCVELTHPIHVTSHSLSKLHQSLSDVEFTIISKIIFAKYIGRLFDQCSRELSC